MSNYSQGVAVEHAVIDDLRANGYDTVRGAGSKGAADVVAIKPGQVLIVSCKRTEMPRPPERAELVRVAAHLPGVGLAIVARKPRREPITYARLTGAAWGAWEPWTPDQVGGVA